MSAVPKLTAKERAAKKIEYRDKFDAELLKASDKTKYKAAERAAMKIRARDEYDNAMKNLEVVKSEPQKEPSDYSHCKQTLDPKYNTSDLIKAAGDEIDKQLPTLAGNIKIANDLQTKNNDLFKAAVQLLINHLIIANKSEYDALTENYQKMLDKDGIIRKDDKLDQKIKDCLAEILVKKYGLSGGRRQRDLFEELFGY